MTHRFGILRRFRFNLPQRIAAGFLLAFLIQGFWLTGHQTLTDRDYQYARCGRETWERPSALAGYYTRCGNIHDGILAYRMAGLPLTVNFAVERALDHFRKPEDRVVQSGSSQVSTWELRHQMTHVLLLLRLPFLFAGCLLGGCVWWVTRRLFGNFGGYTALALYCFSPADFEGVRCAQSRCTDGAWRLRGCVHVHWRCPCHAGTEAQMAAAIGVAYAAV